MTIRFVRGRSMTRVSELPSKGETDTAVQPPPSLSETLRYFGTPGSEMTPPCRLPVQDERIDPSTAKVKMIRRKYLIQNNLPSWNLPFSRATASSSSSPDRGLRKASFLSFSNCSFNFENCLFVSMVNSPFSIHE